MIDLETVAEEWTSPASITAPWIPIVQKLLEANVVSGTMRKVPADELDALRLMAAVVENAADVIFISEAEPIDAPGPKIIYVNAAFEKMTGYAAREIVGNTPRLLHGPKTDRVVLDRIRKALLAWHPVREQIINYRKDGTEFCVELSITPIADASGWFTHWFAVQRDVSEQNALRDNLREGKARLRLLMEALPQLVWTVDNQRRICSVNDSYADFHGAGSESYGSGGWLESVHPEDEAHLLLAWQLAIANKRPFMTETRLRRHDGVYVWFLNRAMPRFDEAGDIAEWIGTSTDISLHKHGEEAIQQAERLASVGRMAATTAHEINNPLSSISNAIFLVLTDPATTEESRGFLEIAMQELKRAVHMTRQSLALHRNYDQPQWIDLPQMVESLLQIFASRLESRNIRLATRLAAGVRIHAFPGEIRQVISNLLMNSMDAVPANGQILVRLVAFAAPAAASSDSRLPASTLPGMQRVRLTVADTGTGMPPGTLKKIFEPFFTTKEVHGMGLGLWVSRKILDQCGATIRVKSRLGAGTVTSIIFRVD